MVNQLNDIFEMEHSLRTKQYIKELEWIGLKYNWDTKTDKAVEDIYNRHKSEINKRNYELVMQNELKEKERLNKLAREGEQLKLDLDESLFEDIN